MQEPLISVIIPTYNRGNTLREAVNSVLSQIHQNLELIVVDDCSKVPVAETLSDITDPRLRIVRHEINQGQATARNTGATHAQGNLLAFLDDDDLWKREKLARQLAYMQKEKSGVAVTDFSLSGPQILYNRHNSKEDAAWLSISGCALALPSSILIEKNIFNQVGGFDANPDMRRIEDWDIALQLHRYGYKLTIVPEFLTVYSGMHRATPEAEMITIQSIEQKHSHAFPPKSKEMGILEAGLGWKKARTEIMAKHYISGVVKLTSVALKHPIHFAHYIKVVIQEPLRHMLSPRHPNKPPKIPFGPDAPTLHKS